MLREKLYGRKSSTVMIGNTGDSEIKKAPDGHL
jgi:hypothetical protein